MNKILNEKSMAALSCAIFAVADAFAAPLPAYGADPAQTSVSGLSSGGFMAVQLQVAYSGSIVGAGVIAGGPYYCAANNPSFVKICMGQVPLVKPDAKLMVSAAKRFAGTGQIDPLDNLPKRRIYVFSGTEDSIVRQSAVDATAAFFEQMGVKPDNLTYANKVPAGHAVIAPGNGNDCPANASPYISRCSVNGKAYDQAGAILQHIHGTLHPRVGTPAGQIVGFDQREYAPAATGMADTAFLYVPQDCTGANARCKVHVALHGCMQSAESIGDTFHTKAGYNNWADTNKILVLYPQVKKNSQTPDNPYGCWDWWGYTDKNYALKSGLQMKAIKAMVDRLAQAK